ncbi:hypothetical protein EPO44_04695 [bacterium]|nr:MAG: hypothetical protein EPO44_04695 [bacterium]
MAFDPMKEESSLERYIADVRSVWGDGNNPQLPFKVKALMEKLLTSTNPKEPWIAQLITEGLPAKELYRDKQHGFILMGHVHGKGHSNSPHDHGPCWVLYGVYHGVTEITTYRCTDNGRVAGRATLEKKEVHRLTRGMVLPYLPGEIHSTFAAEHSVVFRFLSHDLSKVKRHRYDLQDRL